MLEMPKVYYARSGDVRIAYFTLGDGPNDILIAPGATSHLEQNWTIPLLREFYLGAATLGRVITFDKRGNGMSDRDATFTFDERLDDIRAVLDAVGSTQVHLIGISEGGPMSAVFAATFPERVRSLAFYGSFASWRKRPGHPSGDPRTVAEFVRDTEKLVDGFDDDAVIGEWVSVFGPATYAEHPEMLSRACRTLRDRVSPTGFRAHWTAAYEADVRHVLPNLHLPTLVIHRTGDLGVPVGSGRYLAANIPNARYLELPGTEHIEMPGDELVAWIDEQNLKESDVPFSGRSLATVLFSDLVRSTESAVKVGDAAWRSKLDEHDKAVASAVAGHGGRLVKSTGDGVLATFDGPSRAVRCGLELHESLTAFGLKMRVGMHTGEIETRGDDVAGIGVHIAARVAAMAGTGETLVSSTVKDLVSGSGLTFADRGRHALKGVPEEWQLFAATGGF
ncbi:MAG: adenylate/guanylate cyclase domain-containing protein [Anaerolineaceae bacterium]